MSVVAAIILGPPLDATIGWPSRGEVFRGPRSDPGALWDIGISVNRTPLTGYRTGSEARGALATAIEERAREIRFPHAGCRPGKGGPRFGTL